MGVPLRKNVQFQLLWFGGAVSQLGSTTTALAAPLLIIALTGSPFWAGAVGGVRAAALIIALMPAGVWVDRWDRRATLVWSQTVQAGAAPRWPSRSSSIAPPSRSSSSWRSSTACARRSPPPRARPRSRPWCRRTSSRPPTRRKRHAGTRHGSPDRRWARSSWPPDGRCRSSSTPSRSPWRGLRLVRQDPRTRRTAATPEDAPRHQGSGRLALAPAEPARPHRRLPRAEPARRRHAAAGDRAGGERGGTALDTGVVFAGIGVGGILGSLVARGSPSPPASS